MIKFVDGDLLQSDAECLVNPVNCVGVMGKGLAYQFKLKYPNMYKDYIKTCKSLKISVGKIHHYKEKGKIIVNLPTKKHWREKSTLEYVMSGLYALLTFIAEYDIKSIAIPALGCGCGGLEWEIIKEGMLKVLNQMDKDINVYIYNPIN